MKRVFKFFFNLVLALVAVCLTMVVIFLMKPSWQKSLVEEVLARDTARNWQVGTINLALDAIKLENIYVLDGEVGAGIQFIQLDGPMWKLPFTGELNIESGSVIGLDLDVSKVTVGDLTSKNYQGFLERVNSDLDFWEERVGLVLSKLSAKGIQVHIRNMQIKGNVLMPGDKLIPLNWVIERADSEEPGKIKLGPIPDARIL